MSTWLTYKKVGAVWQEETALPRPHADLSKKTLSTQMKVKLADGSFGFLNPETNYTKEVLNLFWKSNDGTVKTQIEGYIENKNSIKIIDHLSNVYIGRFISVEANWLVGRAPDVYDINTIFELISDL